MLAAIYHRKTLELCLEPSDEWQAWMKHETLLGAHDTAPLLVRQEIVILMGGVAAENLILGNHTTLDDTGPSRDLRDALRHARSLAGIDAGQAAARRIVDEALEVASEALREHKDLIQMLAHFLAEMRSLLDVIRGSIQHRASIERRLSESVNSNPSKALSERFFADPFQPRSQGQSQ
ncbi:MAG TPA: hypothetical protein PKC43_06640 [Phycisphaerales bacterium]|nr:hypothetical protein [Phycisphaerales bacterium]HMP37109.1 hypothetical protein [Phycisphaerales bacterium]